MRGLTTEATFALISEVEEAAALTRTGLEVLTAMTWAVDGHPAVLTLLSIGAEKMLKVTLGLIELDAGRPWPSYDVMRKTHGHQLERMNEAAMAHYVAHLGRSTVPGIMRENLTSWGANELGRGVLSAMQRWANAGRFSRLDQLAGQPQKQEPASVLWEEGVESVVLRDEPGLTPADGSDSLAWKTMRAGINRATVDAYAGWWELHWRSWMTGVLGDDAKALASTLKRATE